MKLSHDEVLQQAVLRMYSYADYCRVAVEHGHTPLNWQTVVAHVASFAQELREFEEKEVRPLLKHTPWEIQLTEGAGKPTREGVYRTSANSGLGTTYQRWNGEFFCNYTPGYGAAMGQMKKSVCQDVRWWGLPIKENP
jgi:hypothetical protein